jgi:hypothetical protein
MTGGLGPPAAVSAMKEFLLAGALGDRIARALILFRLLNISFGKQTKFASSDWKVVI